MQLKKAQLIRLEDGSLRVIPLEEVKNGFFDLSHSKENCECIKIDPPKVNLWVYRKYEGVNIMGNEDHTANPPTEAELEKILTENRGICYLKVDDCNELHSPSNGLGHRSILIHLSKETETVAV